MRQAFADEVGKRIAAHCAAHPDATFEERAEAWRNILPAVALETCGVCERRHQSWFAAFQEQLMVLVVGRNLARAVFKRNSRDLGLKAAAKAAMKTLKQAVRAARQNTVRINWRWQDTARAPTGAWCATLIKGECQE